MRRGQSAQAADTGRLGCTHLALAMALLVAAMRLRRGQSPHALLTGRAGCTQELFMGACKQAQMG